MIKFSGINPADRARGVRAYYAHVKPCPSCGGPTNTMFVSEERLILACSQECADKRAVALR
jgi:translation initiation factor 2 beta subunit (eIF-2beta)/eIF-5